MTHVYGCARCGQDHEIDFHELRAPIVIDSLTYTHWAPCPTTGEPIIMRHVRDRLEEQS